MTSEQKTTAEWIMLWIVVLVILLLCLLSRCHA